MFGVLFFYWTWLKDPKIKKIIKKQIFTVPHLSVYSFTEQIYLNLGFYLQLKHRTALTFYPFTSFVVQKICLNGS